MDISKVKSALETAKNEVKKVFTAAMGEVEKGDSRAIKGVPALGRVNVSIDKAIAALDTAAKRTLPRERKAKGKKAA